jgi:hypothetical protein
MTLIVNVFCVQYGTAYLFTVSAELKNERIYISLCIYFTTEEAKDTELKRVQFRKFEPLLFCFVIATFCAPCYKNAGK